MAEILGQRHIEATLSYGCMSVCSRLSPPPVGCRVDCCRPGTASGWRPAGAMPSPIMQHRRRCGPRALGEIVSRDVSSAARGLPARLYLTRAIVRLETPEAPGDPSSSTPRPARPCLCSRHGECSRTHTAHCLCHPGCSLPGRAGGRPDRGRARRRQHVELRAHLHTPISRLGACPPPGDRARGRRTSAGSTRSCASQCG
jgi:hypothetical protein